MSKDDKKSAGPRIVNRKARHEYHILEVVECGMALEGSEVKSLREGQAEINEAYGKIRNGELYLTGATISQYPYAAGTLQHEPLRDRKLLIHGRQVQLLESHIKQKGRTLVPLAIYFKGGWAKCEIGVAIGKKQYDKRQDLKKRDHQREMQREMSRRRKR